MENLVFIQTQRNFDYETDSVIVSGTATEDSRGLINFSGSVNLKGENSTYIGNFTVRIENEETRIDLINIAESYLTEAVTTMRALTLKLKEELGTNS